MPFAVRHDGHPVSADVVGITPAAHMGAASMLVLLQPCCFSAGMHVGQHGEPPAKVCSPPAAHSGGMDVSAGHCAQSGIKSKTNRT